MLRIESVLKGREAIKAEKSLLGRQPGIFGKDRDTI